MRRPLRAEAPVAASAARGPHLAAPMASHLLPKLVANGARGHGAEVLLNQHLAAAAED